jgi:hypothetical protein
MDDNRCEISLHFGLHGGSGLHVLMGDFRNCFKIYQAAKFVNVHLYTCNSALFINCFEYLFQGLEKDVKIVSFELSHYFALFFIAQLLAEYLWALYYTFAVFWYYLKRVIQLHGYCRNIDCFCGNLHAQYPCI